MPYDMEGNAHPEWFNWEWFSFKVRVAISWRIKYYGWLLLGREF